MVLLIIMWINVLSGLYGINIMYCLCYFSLGCKAIFLLGGKSREDPPLAMFLRSGDVVLMAGEARECYHGKSTCLYFLCIYLCMETCFSFSYWDHAILSSLSLIKIYLVDSLVKTIVHRKLHQSVECCYSWSCAMNHLTSVAWKNLEELIVGSTVLCDNFDILTRLMIASPMVINNLFVMIL